MSMENLEGSNDPDDLESMVSEYEGLSAEVTGLLPVYREDDPRWQRMEGIVQVLDEEKVNELRDSGEHDAVADMYSTAIEQLKAFRDELSAKTD